MIKEKKILFIRCSERTWQRFKVFCAKHGFKDQEEALSELLRIAEETPKLVRGRLRWV